MATPTELEVRRELLKLRKGRGLSLAALRGCPAILDALHASDLQDGYGKLVAKLDAMGDSIIYRALKNAYAIDVKDPMTLTARRGDFARDNGKATDTIEGYENQAIAELAIRVDLDRISSL